MKVEHTHSNPLDRAQRAGASAADAARPAKAAQGSGGAKDELALSEHARMLNKARTELAQQPEVRADKVESVRQSVEAGTYQVPIDKLVSRLIGRL